MKQTHQTRLKITIILLSLLVHILLFLILFIAYVDPLQIGNIPLASLAQPAHPEPIIDFANPEWAELQARRSSFGAPVELVEEFTIPAAEEKEETAEEEDASDQTEQKVPSGSLAELSEKSIPTSSSSNPMTSKGKKKKPKFTLAQLTQGYLENTHTDGAYSIGMTGNPHARPTQEQLIFERFAAKLAWEVQNAHMICMHQQQLPPLQGTLQLYFELERNGKMHGLRIIQSSGNAFVDRYILSLFEYASSSFPPVPSLLKQDPVPLLYSCLINFQQPGPLRFKRH